MTTQSSGPRPQPRESPRHDLADPSSNAAWAIVSYVLSGIIFWGVMGWLLDMWIFDQTTRTVVFLPIGVVLGAVAGGYLGYMRFLHSS